MPPILQHECTRVPVTELASCGALLVAAEGPFLRFHHARDSRYIASKRVFKAQTVHGISVYSEEHGGVINFIIWGGPLIRAVQVHLQDERLHVCLSDVVKASDWILDLAPCLSSLEDQTEYEKGTCVAVTAHNALLQVTIERRDRHAGTQNVFTLTLSELTTSSRSILYSAHVFWESNDCVLVAAGTAFGEIMYWSWSRDPLTGSSSCIHRIFLGHEGSIFGIRISRELSSDCCQNLKRIIASCSDDRTIRIWDVSDVAVKASHTRPDQITNPERTRHTGFSNASFDPNPFSSSECLAIGWGHMSRVWTVRFIESTLCEGALLLLSTGEDASSRTWKLLVNIDKDAALPYKLLQQDCAAHHSGKNIWSSTIHGDTIEKQRVICGAADAKITMHPLARNSELAQQSIVYEYTVPDILSLAQVSNALPISEASQHTHKSSKKAEFFRSYCFLDGSSFLLTTNSGNVFVGSTQERSAPHASRGLSTSVLVDQAEDLSGYSICTSEPTYGVAFVAGSKGTLYMYFKTSATWSKFGFMKGKIGEMFAAPVSQPNDHKVVALLITIMGQKEAQLLYVDIAANPQPHIIRTIMVPISEVLTGSVITSMALAVDADTRFLYLGFRRGSVAVYSIAQDQPEPSESATLFRVMEKIHGDETVTALAWESSSSHDSPGHLTSVGRDGCLVIHHVDSHANSVELVHSLTLPIGPNLEGCYFSQGHLLVHGFSSKKWVLYNVTNEEEVMGIETGGAHRSWAFQPGSISQDGGSIVWTRASSMHVCSQTEPNHSVVRPGGHGREIKAVAVSHGPSHRLIATGAEDTDIKLFEYIDGELLFRRTLRKHTTGIQHLQWSANGEYLFSSGGCEEFYIWRVRQVASAVSIGVVCEFTYAPESEHADARIMSFDVTRRNLGYDIAMVFSDSNIKVYRYNPAAAVRWQPLAKGLYFTSCLTQCLFVSPERLLTVGTDGHTAVWSLSSEAIRLSTDSARSASTLSWQQPVRIHQSSSKSMASHQLNDSTQLIVSGGDDGSLAILLTDSTRSTSSSEMAYTAPPVLLNRTHASAVTACAIISHKQGIYVLTSGNDQWIRIWEAKIHEQGNGTLPATSLYGADIVSVSRLGRVKTSVADVSSMAVLDAAEDRPVARVLLCGVGMEVVRVEWDGTA
ncbi:WD40 repeat-like protein [Ophiobolus disseminans]|uniref:WD40 repeat-like protein n=1 Tax=Ophiobolus disseminans TaxID=1469910 RepID=A0A6A6ZSX7_9PLEO|nr:WD40 repeat-like protein [Ophiobolus disseminans]